MDRSLSPAEWKVGASAGKHTQVELPLIGEAPSPALLVELERYERMAA